MSATSRPHCALVLALALALALAPARASPPASYARCRVLDCASNTTLSFSLTAQRLFARVSTRRASADGYVALGLSAGGANAMVGSGAGPQPTDFWVFAAATPANGVAAGAGGVALDASGASYAPPALDASQDLTLEAPPRFDAAAGLLSFEFSRALSTPEAAALGADRALVGTGPNLATLVWALNERAGAINASASALAPGAPLQLLQHSPNARGALAAFDWAAASDCAAAQCPPAHAHGGGGGGGGGASAAAALRAKCFGNGWPSAELAGDRDGGAATPTLAQQAAAQQAPAGACMRSPDGVFSASWSSPQSGGGVGISAANVSRESEGGEGGSERASKRASRRASGHASERASDRSIERASKRASERMSAGSARRPRRAPHHAPLPLAPAGAPLHDELERWRLARARLQRGCARHGRRRYCLRLRGAEGGGRHLVRGPRRLRHDDRRRLRQRPRPARR